MSCYRCLLDETALHDGLSTIASLSAHKAGHSLILASYLLPPLPHPSFEPFLRTPEELSTQFSRIEDLQPANTLAAMKKKKATRSEHNTQWYEREAAAAEADRGGFVVAALARVVPLDLAEATGSAGGDKEVGEQQSIATEPFGLFFYFQISHDAVTSISFIVIHL